MHYLYIDTCIWLNIAKSKNQYALVDTLEYLVGAGDVTIVVPDLVMVEFERNRDRVIASTRQQVNAEFQTVKKIVKTFGGENKEDTLLELNDIGARLPLLSEVTGYMADRLIKLMNDSLQIEITSDVKLKAVERALAKQAPFHRSKNSVADAVLLEAFSAFKTEKGEGTFHFVTDNHTDFSSPNDKRQHHPDFSEIFTQNCLYHLELVDAINAIAPELLQEMKAETEWLDDDTRGLTEILDVMEELTNKIWYNRHMNRMFLIEQGKIQIVPKGTEQHGNNVIHQDILDGALASAKKVQESYADTGPWNDFEWGMLNGKLSALRWVLGDEWDMLDT